MYKRQDERSYSQLRPIEVIRGYTKYAPGAILLKMGGTHVLATATIENRVPRHLMGPNNEVKSGWVTAEYALLPSATHTRNQRERQKLSGRTAEIQRLIGRSLRACIDLEKLGQHTITIDADVLQADGGTRCASITAGFLALHDAISYLIQEKALKHSPILYPIAALSVGIVQGQVVSDLNYHEDQQAEVDANLVMNARGEIIELQATGEEATYTRDQLTQMLDIGWLGIQKLIRVQEELMQRPHVYEPPLY